MNRDSQLHSVTARSVISTDSEVGTSDMQWQKRCKELEAMCAELTETSLKEKRNCNQVVENLKQEKEQLEQKCKVVFTLLCTHMAMKRYKSKTVTSIKYLSLCFLKKKVSDFFYSTCSNF